MLEWNVYISDPNSRKLEHFNVFDHYRFLEDCKENAWKNVRDYAAFCSKLGMDVGYYFGSKCEWELIISVWPTGNHETKIDVNDQLMLNWDQFCNYVWVHAAELRKLRKTDRISRREVAKLVDQIEKGEKNELGR